jgi:hypothetical protein
MLYPNIIFIKYGSYNREFVNGMVFSTVFAYFSNNILISAYYNLKFGISHL